MTGTDTPVDAVVVGGGPAGLQAALSLGRVHRRVVLVDSGEYRNAAVPAMHNVLGHDGLPPSELRARGRAELAAYTDVEVRDGRVESVETLHSADVEGEEPLFRVRCDSGVVLTRAVVLALGLHDVLPEIDGLAEIWGDEAAQCPFCHGHETAGKRVAVLASPAAEHQVAMLAPIVGPNGRLEIVDQVTSTLRGPDGVVVRRAGGEELVVDAVFLMPSYELRSTLPAELGLDLNPDGTIRIDLRGHTSVPGIYAAGDAAHHPEMPMAHPSVAASVAAGAAAGGAVVADEVLRSAQVRS